MSAVAAGGGMQHRVPVICRSAVDRRRSVVFIPVIDPFHHLTSTTAKESLLKLPDISADKEKSDSEEEGVVCNKAGDEREDIIDHVTGDEREDWDAARQHRLNER